MSQLQYVPLGNYNFGFTVPLPLAWNPTVYCLVAAFSAVPMWMTIELTFQIFATFKKYSGLYFWSLLFCTWCITLRQIGRLCIYFVPGCNQVFSLIFAMLGWIGTVSGFSVVLYSRLHLVTRNRRILRGVLYMIVANVFILHLPTMVGQIGVVTKIHPKWRSFYVVMEKLQIVGFTVQETIISGIYIYKAWAMVKKGYNDHTKQCIRVLMLVQIACILLDMPFIVLAYTEIFLLKATLTSFSYAIKLKLEFRVLNQLINIAKNGIAPRGVHQLDEEQGPEPSTRRPCAAVLLPNKRRFSLAPIWWGKSISTSLPKPAMKTPSAGISEKSAETSDPPASTQVDSVAHNTLMESERTTNSVDDEILAPREEDKSFADTERCYLGQYGKRMTL